MSQHGLVLPVLALIGWTFVMWVWMYSTRIPAMRRARIDLDEVARTGVKLPLPPEVTRVADNYNHLHEQPTLFYALALAAQISGGADSLNITLAWVYVLIRIVHSLVQATRNKIIVRFAIFNIGSIVLLVMLVRTFMLVLGR